MNTTILDHDACSIEGVGDRVLHAKRIRRLLSPLSLWLGAAFVATMVSPLGALVAHGLKSAWVIFAIALGVTPLAKRRLWPQFGLECEARWLELLMLGLWLTVIVGNLILDRGYAGAMQLMQAVTLLMLVVLAMLYSSVDDGSDRALWAAIILLLGLEVARSLPTLWAQPMLPRRVMLPGPAQAQISEVAALASVGEYGYYTSLAIALPFMLGFALDSARSWRMPLLLAAAAMGLAIGLASFMGAILLMVAGFALLVLLSVLYKRLPMRVLAIFVVLGVIGAVLWFSVLIHTDQGAMVQNKITTQLASVRQYGLVEGEITGRVGLTDLSIQTFLANPLFGIGPTSGIINPDLWTLVGGHSSWFDMPAEYGLIGSGFYLGFLLAVMHRAIRSIRHSPGIAPVGRLTTLLLFILYGFANPVAFQTQINALVFFVVLGGARLTTMTGLQRGKSANEQ